MTNLNQCHTIIIANNVIIVHAWTIHSNCHSVVVNDFVESL